MSTPPKAPNHSATMNEFTLSASSAGYADPLAIPVQFNLNAIIEDMVQRATDRRIVELVQQQERAKERAKLANPREISERYGLGISRTIDWARAGKLPAHRLPGSNRYYFIIGECDDAVEAFRRTDGALKGTRRGGPKHKEAA